MEQAPERAMTPRIETPIATSAQATLSSGITLQAHGLIPMGMFRQLQKTATMTNHQTDGASTDAELTAIVREEELALVQTGARAPVDAEQ